MATTDLSDWYLRDTNLTTTLGILPVAQSHLYMEINEPGSGELRLPLDTTQAARITSGMFAECYYRGSSHGGFFIENIKETKADAGEYGGRWMSISGRGPLALLEDAIVWDDGTTSTSREFTSVTKASILITLITEAKARGALANLTYDFSASQDTATVAWTDSEHYKLPVGTSLLDVARQFAKTGGFDFEINLSGANFVLSAYSAGSGSDLSETVFMRTGTNCKEVSSDERGDEINNALRVKYKSAFLTVSDSTSITNRRRREKLLSLEQAQTSASATTYASAKIAQTKDPRKSIAVRVYDGVKPNLFLDYDMGDTVTLDVLGTETTYRVLGIQADFDGADFSNVVLELNTILYDKQLEMSEDLDWLLDQWNTAKDAGLQEVSFWANIVSYGTVNALHEYNGKIYVGGAFTAQPYLPVGGAYIVAYNPATRLYESLTGYPGSSVYSITHIGTSIYVAGDGLDIWEYAAGTWSSIGTVTTSGAFVIRSLVTDGTNLYVGGQGIAGIHIGAGPDVTINSNVAKYNGAAWSSVGTAGDTLFCYTLIWFSGALYGGFDWDTTPSSSFQKFSGGAWAVVQSATDGVIAFGATSTQLVISQDEKIYVWDGVVATWTLIATLTGFASGLAITTNLEDIYLGGKFSAIDGDTSITDLAKYSGGAWSALGTGVGAFSILALLYDTQGDLYIGGLFDILNGIYCLDFGVYMTDFENMQAYNGIGGGAGVNWGEITGTLADQVDLQAALDAKPDFSFQTIAVSGQSDVVADAEADTLTLVAGTGVAITTNAGTDTITVTAHAAVTLDANADTLLSLSTQALGLDTQLANKVFAGATSGGAAVPAFRSLVAADIPALSYGDISGTGVAGQVAEFVTNTKTLQAAKIIGPAVNILTLTNAAAATLALNITAAKTLTLTAADNYNLTVPATGTAALLATENIYTAIQKINVNSTTALLVEQDGVKDNTFIVDTTNGRVGINGVPNVALTCTGVFRNTGDINIIGGNITGGSSLTDNANKYYRLLTYHFHNEEKPIVAFFGGGQDGNSFVTFGGGSSSYNAVPNLFFYTAPNDTTLLGNLRLNINNNTATLQGFADAVQFIVNGFTTQTLPLAKFVDNTAATAVVRNVLQLETQSTGTAAAGLGAGLLFSLETATASTMQTAAQIAAVWTDATNATRKAKLQLSAYDTAIRTGIEISANGTTPDITLLGDTWFVGAGSGLPFGSCWGLEIAQVQASAAQNTWYAVNDTDMTDGQLNLVTHDGSGKLTVTYAGKYLVNWSMTFEANANNKHIHVGLGINGTAQSDGQSHIESVTNQELTLAGTAILALTAGQYVQVLFETTDTGTPNITIDDVNLSIVQIGA